MKVHQAHRAVRIDVEWPPTAYERLIKEKEVMREAAQKRYDEWRAAANHSTRDTMTAVEDALIRCKQIDIRTRKAIREARERSQTKDPY